MDLVGIVTRGSAPRKIEFSAPRGTTRGISGCEACTVLGEGQEKPAAVGCLIGVVGRMNH